MTSNKNILIIGLDPFILDFTSPDFIPGLTAEKVMNGLNSSIKELVELGYNAELCLTDFGQTASAVAQEHLQNKQFDVILIGAGVRVPPSNFLLFEKLINTVHQFAPKGKICFNTNPMDTAESIKRWL